MKHGSGSPALWAFFQMIFLATLLSGATQAAGSPHDKRVYSSLASSQEKAATAAVDSSGYVGAETCKTCHDDIYSLYMKTKHRQTVTDTHASPSKQGCEACHGPGAAHSADPSQPMFNFKTASPAERSARCLTCHSSDKSHEAYNTSEHKLMGVSCDQCHDPHLSVADPKSRVEPRLAQATFFNAPSMTEQNRWLDQSLLREPQPVLCFRCHGTIQAQFALPTHHRVPEGLMKCTDCHNPHGTENRAQLTKPGWETCVTCHVEKRGPFVYEHASVKIEGCVACHNPHGSINRNLLLRGEGRFLCLQCHVNPQAINVPHGRLGYQTAGDCVRCHATIHGSNSNEFFLN